MLIAIDKPSNITSYDVIRILKNNFPNKKIGHGGTLDPMATGLLIIGIGKDTKKLGSIQTGSKSYLTTIDFSKKSDTWDMDYRKDFEELDTKKLKVPSEDEIKEKLQTLIPSAMLPLTPFSAKKKDGQKLYELARKGELIYEDREMKISDIKILNYQFPLLELEIAVGGGTYIRSIAHRIGEQFLLGGILISLRRHKLGEINIQDKKFKTISGDLRGEKFVLNYFEIE